MINVYEAVNKGVVFDGESLPVSQTMVPVGATLILLARVQVPSLSLHEATTLIADGVTCSEV